MACGMNRTLASAMAKFAPPVCRLRKEYKFGQSPANIQSISRYLANFLKKSHFVLAILICVWETQIRVSLLSSPGVRSCGLNF